VSIDDLKMTGTPVQDSLDGHSSSVRHPSTAVEGSIFPQAIPTTSPKDVTPAGDLSSEELDATLSPWPEHLDHDVAAAADTLNDIERLRIASVNRLRQFIRPLDEVDKDGGQRGFGWDLRSPAVAALATLIATMQCDNELMLTVLGKEKPKKPRGCCFIVTMGNSEERAAQQRGSCLEHDAERNLTRALRAHPLGAWVKAQKHIGEKQGGRLIGAIGDPYIRPELLLPDGSVDPMRARTISELRAYCGFGEDKTNPRHIQKRARGQRSNWSAAAKMRAYLVAESCMKGLRKPCERVEGDDFAVHVEGCNCSPWRLVYDRERARYADAVHDEECVRCGPSGKPAQSGSPLSLGHKKGRALRRVAKEIVDELWREARRIHLETAADGQTFPGAHDTCAVGGD
jgi:hypothetical protein